MNPAHWQALNARITSCRLCPRLVNFREETGNRKKACFQDEEYWSKPLTGMGDPNGRLLVLGLAPAAHGGNRTGRIFTGGSSASFLMRALWEAGFANQPESKTRSDSLQLTDTYVTNLVRCAPPANRPAPQETSNCRPYLVSELNLLKNIRVVVPLGSFALKGYLSVLKDAGMIEALSSFPFRHGTIYSTHRQGPSLVPCYHPSQQNTFTGKLTTDMMRGIFVLARSLIRGV